MSVSHYQQSADHHLIDEGKTYGGENHWIARAKAFDFGLQSQQQTFNPCPAAFEPASEAGRVLNRICADEAVGFASESASNHLMSKRIVRVYIVDPAEAVPAEKSLLYKSEELFTDLSDQELFFSIPIQDLLKKHNEYRVTLVDKKATARGQTEVRLDEIRIRDLRMQVVVLATF